MTQLKLPISCDLLEVRGIPNKHSASEWLPFKFHLHNKSAPSLFNGLNLMVASDHLRQKARTEATRRAVL